MIASKELIVAANIDRSRQIYEYFEEKVKTSEKRQLLVESNRINDTTLKIPLRKLLSKRIRQGIPPKNTAKEYRQRIRQRIPPKNTDKEYDKNNDKEYRCYGRYGNDQPNSTGSEVCS